VSDDEKCAIVESHRRNVQQSALSASRMGRTPRIIYRQPWLRQRFCRSEGSPRKSSQHGLKRRWPYVRPAGRRDHRILC
jgi:hypothetical protein